MRDEHADKSGRCPFCKAVVRIPARSDDSAEALAQAVRSGPDAGDSSRHAVPPPPSASPSSPEDSLSEELNLVPIAKDPASETDIIPATRDQESQHELNVNHGTAEQVSPATSAARKADVPTTAPALRQRRKKPSLLKGFLWAWVAIATAAVVGLLVYVMVTQS